MPLILKQTFNLNVTSFLVLKPRLQSSELQASSTVRYRKVNIALVEHAPICLNLTHGEGKKQNSIVQIHLDIAFQHNWFTIFIPAG